MNYEDVLKTLPAGTLVFVMPAIQPNAAAPKPKKTGPPKPKKAAAPKSEVLNKPLQAMAVAATIPEKAKPRVKKVKAVQEAASAVEAAAAPVAKKARVTKPVVKVEKVAAANE